jgi:peptide/nickel transport system substrate-binding protein
VVKRLLVVALVGVAAFVLLGACAPTTPPTNATPPTAVAASAPAAAPTSSSSNAAPAAAAATLPPSTAATAPAVPAPAVSAAQPTGTLNVGLPLVGPYACQPRLTESAVAGRAIMASGAYEPLVTTDANGNYTGVLADSWSLAPDQHTWTFKLKQGVQFHKGYGEMTSDDVVYSLMQHAAEGSLNGNAGSLRRLFQSITAPDKYTVVIDTGTPQIDLLNFLRGPIAGTAYIISKKQVDQIGEDALAAQGCAGTGPWEFVEAKTGQYWRFKAVPSHYRKTPEFAELMLWEIPEEATRVANFQAGKLDTLLASPDSLPTLQQTNGTRLMTPGGGVDLHLGVYGNYYVKKWPGYDPTLPWVSSNPDPTSPEWQRAVKVRQAMAISIDRDTIVNTLLHGAGAPATLWGWGPNKDKLDPDIHYPFDPARAKALLTEAGYPDGFDVTLNVRIAGAPAEVPACEAIATMWGNIGLHVNFENRPNDAIRTALVDRSYNGIVCQAVGDVPEPINQYVNWALSSAGFSGGIEHPVLDDLINQATMTVDPAARMDIEKQIARFTFDNALDIGVYTAYVQWPIGPNIEDWSKFWQFGDARIINSLEYVSHKQ